MMLLLIALIAYTYAEILEESLWYGVYQETCDEFCTNNNLGHCDQYQFVAVDTSEKVESLLHKTIHPAYNCNVFEKGKQVGYERADGWLQFKCNYFDSELNVEDTIELCQGKRRVNKMCPCTTHSHSFQSYTPTSQPTSFPTISKVPTSEPTSFPTHKPTYSPKSQFTSEVLHPKNQIILIVLSIATVFIIIGCCFYKCIRNRKTSIETQSEQQIQGHNERPLEVVVPVVSEIPVVRAYVIPEYPQPSAPPKIDIEMGIK